MEDSLIIKNISKKKEAGLEMLVDKYGGFILGIIRRELYNLSNYEDECMDDVLMAIWNNVDKYNKDKNTFKNWIASVTKYKVIDYKRKYIKTLQEEPIDINMTKENQHIDSGVLQEELRKEIEIMLDCLKPKDKQLFIKYYLKGRNVDELSEETGMKRDVIYNRLSRGRNKLRNILSVERFY